MMMWLNFIDLVYGYNKYNKLLVRGWIMSCRSGCGSYSCFFVLCHVMPCVCMGVYMCTCMWICICMCFLISCDVVTFTVPAYLSECRSLFDMFATTSTTSTPCLSMLSFASLIRTWHETTMKSTIQGSTWVSWCMMKINIMTIMIISMDDVWCMMYGADDDVMHVECCQHIHAYHACLVLSLHLHLNLIVVFISYNPTPHIFVLQHGHHHNHVLIGICLQQWCGKWQDKRQVQ